MALASRPLGSEPLASAPAAGGGGGTTVAVPAGSLTLTGNAPTVSTTANQVIAVPAGSLTLTGIAPTVVATAHQTIAVPAGSLTLTGFAPTVVVNAHQTIAVPAGSLTLTGNAPTVTATANQTIAVAAGSLVLVGWPPTVSDGTVQVQTRPYPGPAGSVRRGRKPHRTVVEVDGELITVNGRNEAEALLESVRNKAREEAPKAAKRVLNKAREVNRAEGEFPSVAVEPPRVEPVEVTDSMAAMIERINADVARIYERAQRDAEVAYWARRQYFEQDEEDALIALLL